MCLSPGCEKEMLDHQIDPMISLRPFFLECIHTKHRISRGICSFFSPSNHLYSSLLKLISALMKVIISQVRCLSLKISIVAPLTRKLWSEHDLFVTLLADKISQNDVINNSLPLSLSIYCSSSSSILLVQLVRWNSFNCCTPPLVKWFQIH